MQDKEIITKWKAGLSKNQLATMYKRQYDQEIKIIRSTVRHRHDGRYISNYEALAYVERVIYEYIRRKWRYMKSEKGVIEIFIIGIVIILLIILFTAIGMAIKEENDYGIKEGQVIDKDYRSAYTTMIPSGKIIVPQHHPESYKIQIQKEIDSTVKTIWVTVDRDTYHKINVGDYYNRMEWYKWQ